MLKRKIPWLVFCMVLTSCEDKRNASSSLFPEVAKWAGFYRSDVTGDSLLYLWVEGSAACVEYDGFTQRTSEVTLANNIVEIGFPYATLVLQDDGRVYFKNNVGLYSPVTDVVESEGFIINFESDRAYSHDPCRDWGYLGIEWVCWATSDGARRCSRDVISGEQYGLAGKGRTLSPISSEADPCYGDGVGGCTRNFELSLTLPTDALWSTVDRAQTWSKGEVVDDGGALAYSCMVTREVTLRKVPYYRHDSCK